MLNTKNTKLIQKKIGKEEQKKKEQMRQMPSGMF